MPNMKAVRILAYGGPEVLIHEDVPRPAPGPGEVLVRVHAASINPVDWKIRAGYMKEYIPLSLPAILGLDISGIVESVGPGVKSFKAGDEVYAMNDPLKCGAYAEYLSIPESILAPKPRSVDHLKAAALPLAGLTAWHALLEFGGVKPGRKVLIHGAAGGVGSFAVQIAKALGATVIGTAQTRNLSLLKELGADQAIDYTAGPFEKEASEVDLVIDTVGGETERRSWGVLKKGGVLASTVSQAAAPYPGVTGKYVANRPNAEGLRELAKLVDAGKLRPIVETVLPLSETRKGHELSQTGHVRGKIVLRTI
ncbi:MAG TPA: NADP-dependent oxidoreductase [Fibrobacteria bacterium]|nr:NADP-dependent oxidoreductase [Fibrobacteria bacterium]